MYRVILTLACGTAALAQQYTITTAAGGAPPATPVAATSISIGQPNRVAVDAAGNFYFSSTNAVFRVSSGGALTLVAGNSRAGFSGDGGPAARAQLNNPQGIAVDAAGNIYIADAGNNRVRKVTAAGVIATFAGNGNVSPGSPRTYNDGGPATDALLHLPSGVAVDKSGNVYIADTADNTIRIVTPDGIINNFAGDSYPSHAGDGGNPNDAELKSPGDVAVDSSGNVFIADTGNAAIRKIAAADGKITTIAGTGLPSFTGDGADATKSTIYTPISLAVDGSGNLYIVENGDSRIRKIDSKNIITTIAGTGLAGFAGDGSAATGAQMNSPTGIAVDSSGNLYIADSLNLRVRKIASGNISSVAGNGVLAYAGDGGPATSALLNGPQGVAADSSGNLYVADTNNNVVRRVTRAGVISAFAGNGQAGSSGDGSAATGAQLNAPQGVAADAAGNVYIADAQNARVRRVSANGSISTVAGNGTSGFAGDGAAATSAQLYTPAGVAVDSAGNLYIADFNNNRVRKVSTGGTITTVAGNGNSGYSGDGGPAVNARLTLPQAVAVDSAGNLYIADTGNNRIRMVTPNGLISTVAGNGLPGYSGDNSAATGAVIGNPSGVAVDSAGSLYISDGGARIRKVYPGGLVTTIAGTGARGYSGDGGSATSGTLNGPTGISLDSSGNLYVADTGNNAVRALQFTGFGLTVSAVTNGASNTTGAIAPGEIVVLYGSGLGPAGLVKATLNDSGLVGTSLAGTSVFFNNAAAPILYTSANQVAAIVPYGVTGARALVTVQYQGQVSAGVTVDVVATAPAIFTANVSGSGPALAVNLQDGALNDVAHPARAGTYVTLYATGEGKTNPPGTDGQPAAVPLPLPVLQVTATVGGKAATVQYAGGAPAIVAGVMQVNVQIPTGLTAGPVDVAILVGGVPSQKGVTIFVGN